MSNEGEKGSAAVRDPNAYYASGLGVETYDLLHDPITSDIAFYLKCASRFGDPVLELGTGTGRVLLPLVEAGYEVTGLDLSPAMLRLARAKVDSLARLVTQLAQLLQVRVQSSAAAVTEEPVELWAPRKQAAGAGEQGRSYQD